MRREAAGLVRGRPISEIVVRRRELAALRRLHDPPDAFAAPRTPACGIAWLRRFLPHGRLRDHNVAPAGSGTTNTQKLSQQLETLRDLYNRKLITKAVYESESQKAVREYTSQPASK